MAAVHLSALRGRPLLLLSAELVNGKIFLASRVTGDAAQAHGCCLELENEGCRTLREVLQSQEGPY